MSEYFIPSEEYLKHNSLQSRSLGAEQTVGCPKITIFLNFVLSLKPLNIYSERRPHKIFQRYRPINDPLRTILSAQGDIHGEIPPNRLLAITFDWSVLGTSG